MAIYSEKDKVYLKRLLRYKFLEKEEEAQLSKRWHLYRDEKALHHLIQAYFKLVVAQAFKFKGYGLPLTDLIQEGVLGLMTAGKKFEPAIYNVRFSTYARWWIKASMQDFILKNWSIVKVSNTTSSRRLFFNLSHLKKKISHLENDALALPEIKAIAEMLKTTIQDVAEVEKRLNYSDFSLSAPVNRNTNETFESYLEDDVISPEEACYQADLLRRQVEFIQKVLSILTEEERKIIESKYLSEKDTDNIVDINGKKMTQKEIKNLESKAFRKIKYTIIHNKDLEIKDLY